jgi:hypothetical protein
MNTPKKPLTPNVPARPSDPAAEKDSLESGWFVTPDSSTRPAARPQPSVPPTGDRDLDSWLR